MLEGRVAHGVGDGAAQLIAYIGALEGNFAHHVADGHTVDDTVAAGGLALAETDEDGVAGIEGVDILNEHVAHFAAVDSLDGYGRAEGVADLDVTNGDVLETTGRVGAELDGRRRALHSAVVDLDVVAGELELV